MDEIPTGFLMAFLLPFHLGGGVALGIALRQLFRQPFKLSNLGDNGFLLLWGSMFGGLPLVFGLTAGVAWFVFLQLAVFLGTILGVALFYEWLRALYSQPGMWIASFGFVFFLIGAALTVSLLNAGDSEGLLVGLIFGGVGGLLTLLGVGMLWRGGRP